MTRGGRAEISARPRIRHVIVIFYKHPDGGSIAGIPAPEVTPDDARREPGDEPAYCVRGADWSECMQAYYDIEGFGTYVPFCER